MPPSQEIQEKPPAIDERLQAVAGWIQANYKPALRVITEGEQLADEELQQEFEVREYQLEAWANVWDARQEGKARGLVHLATGLGKTSVAVFDVMKYREECAAQDPPMIPRILFVSHMNDISEQAQERFGHFMPDTETTYFKTKQKGLPDADITFATFQSLHSELDRFDHQDFEYIIYDEAHHSEAETFKKVREYFDPLFELALTATPDRMDQQNIREYFGEPLYKKTLPEAIAEGWLADVDYHIVFDDIIKQLMEEGFEPKTLKEFHEIFKIRPRNEVIAKNIREERHKIGLDAAKTIIFCEDIAHAEEMAELLDGVAYHSDLKKDDRKEILKDFRIGDGQVICTVDAFNEGIDIPDARLVVFLRSTQSGTVFEQQLGRGLRKTTGKDKVSVLDFVANIERIQKVQELSEGIRDLNGGGGGEGSEGQTTIIDLVPGGEDDIEDGLQIHASHGDFDFDRLAVNLLEKWALLRERGDERSEWSPWSNEDLVSLALELSPDRPLYMRRIKELSKSKAYPGSDFIKKRFGSLLDFQRACGFEVKSPASLSEFSNDELIDLALELSPDRPITTSQLKKLSSERRFPSPGTIRSRFGSLLDFQRACGFEVSDWTKFSSDELIDLAKRLSPDKPLGIKNIAELSKQGIFPSMGLISKRFESMEMFQRACGFDAVKPYWSDFTDRELVRLALQLSPDKPISRTTHRNLARERAFPGVDVIQDRFGSISNFHAACGFKNN